MQDLNIEEISMQLIIHSGVAKSNAMMSMQLAKQKKWVEIEEMLVEAKENLNLAAKAHFEMIQHEAKGNDIQFKLILMHAEDQFLNSQTIVELVEQIIELQK